VKRRTGIIIIVVFLVLTAALVLLYELLHRRISPSSDEVNEAVRRGYGFLRESLWDEPEGAYRECPVGSGGLENKYWGDDNYLALIFHRDYKRFEDPERVSRIQDFLEKGPLRSEEGQSRWCVLSGDRYLEYEPYNRSEYADEVALNGIYYAKIGNTDLAREKFSYLIENMYRNGLIEDKATPENGHEYYKLALALVLAHHLKEETPEAYQYVPVLTQKLLDLQRSDGSWLTDDKDLDTTYPNTETTILILLSLYAYD